MIHNWFHWGLHQENLFPRESKNQANGKQTLDTALLALVPSSGETEAQACLTP